MKRLVLVLGLVAAVAAPVAASGQPSADRGGPVWRQSLDGPVGPVRQDRAFREEAGGVTIEARLSFAPETQVLHLEGVYRTTQMLDPRAKLSYQLLADDGRMLQFDGERFDWRAGGDGSREAAFEIEHSLAATPGLRPGLRVRFNYVVEQEFWYRDRHPGVFLPELALQGPCRPADFSVPWAWIPPVLPTDTDCALPAWISVESGEGPSDYRAVTDVQGRTGRIEAPRRPLPAGPERTGWVVYRLGEMPVGAVQMRPGFVWDGVEWFDRYVDNPYRTVWMVGPLVYDIGLTLAGLGLWWTLRRLRLVGARWMRWGGYGIGGLATIGLVSLAAVSLHLVLALGVALIWWLQRRIAEPGPRAYWTTWGFLVLLEIYWGYVCVDGGGLWTGTALSACLAALALLPLRWMTRPVRAGWAGVAVGFVATLLATVLAVYFSFFRDYPGLRDLLYAGQIGEVGDSLATVIGQRHLAPWWLWACATVGLWRR